MENLLDYLIYALLGHDYTVGRRSIGYDGKTSQWMIEIAGDVRIILDENDVKVLRFMADTSKDPDTVERINKLLTYFV